MENSALIDMENKLQTAFGIGGGFFHEIGIILGVFLQLSTMTSFLRIAKEGSSGEVSLTRYYIAFMNSWFFMGYAASSSNRFPFIGSVTSGAIAFYLILLVILNSPTTEMRLKRIGVLLVVMEVLLAQKYVSYSMHGIPKERFNGFVASAFAIAIHSLSLVKLMPFYTSILMFLNGAFWFVFGLLQQDVFLILPNGVSCVVGAVHMYFIYQDRKGKRTKAKTA